MKEHLQAIATLFSLVNPAVCVVIFKSIIPGRSRAEAVRAATMSMLIVGGVLLIAAIAGAHLLKLFGISLDAFSVAGGAVLIFIGFSMLRGEASPATPAKQAPAGAEPANLGKLILFAASPGTITGVITIAASHRHLAVPTTAIAAIAIVLSLTWVLLLAATRKAETSTAPGLARDMVGRYMGLIIIAMGIQFALTGYKAFMAA